jgi:general secretion pathway protein D
MFAPWEIASSWIAARLFVPVIACGLLIAAESASAAPPTGASASSRSVSPKSASGTPRNAAAKSADPVGTAVAAAPAGSPELPAEEGDLPAGNNEVTDVDEARALKGGNAKTGAAVVKVPSRRGAAAVAAGQELVNIDFPEPTEIKDIIKAVALWTGKNVILDRNVNGKVQIISPRKVTKEEAYQAFLSALNLLGLTTVETGKVIKIMPVRTAVKGNLKTFLGSSWTMMTDEIITQIVPLKYIDAKEIQSTLSRIVSSNSMIAYQPTNTLIISDSGYKVRRVLDILELLDVQGQQAQVAIVPIRFAEAKSITEKVSEIFKSSAEAKKGAAGSGGYRSYKIMTDDRTNSVIIFGPPRTIADVKALVRKFDVQLDDPSRMTTIHVRPLDYADAKKLASTLQALATGKKQPGAEFMARPPVNMPGGAGGNVGQPISVAALSDDVKIAPDDATNSLLITGSRAAYQTINSLIRKLDLRRSQVFVESDILDINMDNNFRFGSSVFAGRGGPSNTSIATGWQAGQLAPLIAAQAAANVPGASTVSTQTVTQAAAPFADEMTIGILSGKQVSIPGLGTFSPGALIKMMKQDSNARVLSTPNILTSNNEEAQIVVGQTLYFTSREITPSTGAIANRPEKVDVDLTLAVKPNISQSDYVTLQVTIESNSIQSVDPTTGLPLLNKRKSKQIVTVKNMQTVVVSGLVQTTEIQSYQKIPLLGDIPLIGFLFRNTTSRKQRNNLMIFLTPHIIHGADDLAAIYKKKLDERDEFLQSIFGSGHVKDDFYALLPTKEDGQYVPDESDKDEKKRREEMLRDIAADAEQPNYQKKDDEKEREKDRDKEPQNNAKPDDSPTYVPMSADGDGGGGDVGGGDSAPAEAPPPPPPPEGGGE